jgi:hypothetical protein
MPSLTPKPASLRAAGVGYVTLVSCWCTLESKVWTTHFDYTLPHTDTSQMRLHCSRVCDWCSAAIAHS